MAIDVIWVANAEQKLATLWVQASDRGAVTRAANRIDDLLSQDPEHEGESRPHGRRILHCKPLGVTYRVVRGQNQVLVLRVWSF